MHGDAKEVDPQPPPAWNTIQKNQKHHRTDQRDESEQQDHGIIQNHCFPRNTKTSDRQNSGWNDTRIPDGC